MTFGYLQHSFNLQTDWRRVPLRLIRFVNSSGISQVSRHTKNLARFGYIGIDHDTYTIAGESGSENERTLSSFAKEFLEYSSGVHTRKPRQVVRLRSMNLLASKATEI